MRKSLCIGTVTAALTCVAGYWYFNRTPTTPNLVQGEPTNNEWRRPARNDGDAEMSEPIEPLVVERGRQLPMAIPGGEIVEPMPRVILTPGMQQPPRPDGRALRMPYADEEEILALPLDPIQRLLDVTLPKLDLIDDLKAAEESEPTQLIPPAQMHPHHQHCPYHGGCPAPYPYRALPRDR